MLTAWIVSMGIIGYFLAFAIGLLALFCFICEIVGIVTVIKWIANRGKKKNSKPHSASDLTAEEREWLFGKK